MKLGSDGFLREGKRGKRPLQQRKNQRRNLDLGFQSLAGFGIPHKKKKFKEFRGPEIRITFHGAKCSFPEAYPEKGPGAPLFLDRSGAQRALKNIFGLVNHVNLHAAETKKTHSVRSKPSYSAHFDILGIGHYLSPGVGGKDLG